MESAETIIVSKPVQMVLQSVAAALKWGKVVVEVKDGKVVMAKLERDIKLSTN